MTVADGTFIARRNPFRVGFGQRPAVIAVDLQNDFIDASAPSSCGPLAVERLPDVRRLLAAARRSKVPVIYTQGLVAPDLSDVGLWKGKAHRSGQTQIEGTWGAQIHDDVRPHEGDHVVSKRRPSGFFGTDLLDRLHLLDVDSLIVCGSSMSGCVRATAVDGFSYDYRVAVVEECVIDRNLDLIHRNLEDIDRKYCDAVSLDEVLGLFDELDPPQ